MQIFLTVLQIILSASLIVLILIQHGKGADAGAAFGSGASATVFGAKGSASFLTRTTAIIATLFFITSIAMAYYAMQKPVATDLMRNVKVQQPAQSEVPNAPLENKPAESTSDIPNKPVQ